MNANSNQFPPDAREQTAEILHRAPADEFALSAATRDYHWNVRGPQFRSLSELFGDQYRQLDQWMEKLGDRARAFGATAHTSWTDLIRSARFTPARGVDLSVPGMMSGLIGPHDQMVERLRADAHICAAAGHDLATAELLKAPGEFHETTAWMLGELLEDRELVPA
jgi:starvation-inducible DNA-binding protein